MLMSHREFEALDAQSLEQFIALRADEGAYLDYKLSVARPMGKAEKKEFLKDISGFANSGGGILIYGCDEPSRQPTWQQQLVGIADGPGLATDMERIAASAVDPRVPGLRFRAILLTNTNYCIVVYVPPSSVKPHMVTLDRSNRFFIRHSESTNPMTTQEVRSAVLSAYSREDILEKMSQDITEQFECSNFSDKCSLIIQALHLTEPSEPWQIYEDSFEQAIRGQNRSREFHDSYSFNTNYRIEIDVQERYSVGQREEPQQWKLGVKANGHIYLMYANFWQNEVKFQNGEVATHPYVSSYKNQLFCSFGAVVDEMLSASDTIHGYRIICELRNAERLMMFIGEYGGSYIGPLNRSVAQS